MMFSIFKGLLAGCLLAQAAFGKLYVHDESFVPDEILRVTYENRTIGCVERTTALVNGTSPGPTLRFTKGKTIWIRVYNDFADSNLTMHWHGISQASAPFSDGTPQASQWPIPAGHFFDYELDLRDVTVGTYFYHSHWNFQVVSVNGPLIIEEPEGSAKPYNYDDEFIVHLTDVFNRTDQSITTGLRADPFVWSGETNGIVFNGVSMSTSSEHTPGPGCGLQTYEVEPNTTYRIRFIGATALTFASMAFQDHTNLTVIEADGDYVKPAGVSFIQLGTGQRFSTLFKTKTCEELAQAGKAEYYIQAETRERPTNDTNYAILKYNIGNKCPGLNLHQPPLSTSTYPAKAPLTLPPTDLNYLEYTLENLVPNGFPTADEVTRRVTVTTQQVSAAYVYWIENGYNWTQTATVVPYLVALYENEQQFLPNYTYAVEHEGIDPRVGAFPAKIGEVLEIVWQNEATDSNGGFDVHPFHAHGKHYYDIGSGNGTYDAAANEAKLANWHPATRDTTFLYPYLTQASNSTKLGWRAWRLRVEQPGVWMIHCHTTQHMIMGMQTVWVFGNTSEIYKDVPRPEVAGYLTYGGNVYGNESYSPTVNHFYDH